MNSLRSERGAVAPLVLTVVALLSAVLVVVPYFILGQTVPPNYIGLRRNYFSIPLVLKKGFEEEGLVPGRHYQIPGLTTVFLLPRNFLFVNLNEGREGGDLDKPELLIPTTDGSKVKTDVSLILRLYEGPEHADDQTTPAVQTGSGEAAPIPVHKKRAHGGPLNLVSAFPIDTLSQLEIFAQIAESELKSALSALSTSDYYNPVLRERATLEAAEAINSKVAPNGIELWSALVRRYVYADPSIDNQIFEKNLEDQTRRLNAAASQLAEMRAKTEQMRASWDAKIRDLQVEGQTASKVLVSEGELYEAKKRAEGDLLVAKARADVDGAKARVLSEVDGANVYVAREMTPFLKTLTGGVVTELDPYDVNGWLERLTGAPANGGRGGNGR